MDDEELKKDIENLVWLVAKLGQTPSIDTFNLVGILATIEESTERMRKALFADILGPKKM